MYLSFLRRFLTLYAIIFLVIMAFVYYSVQNIRNVHDVDQELLEVPTVDASMQRQFREYVVRYNRSYGAEEYKRRRRYFEDSLKEIFRLNALHGTTVFGVNKFSDFSPEERSDLFMRAPAKCKKLKIDSCNGAGSGGVRNHTDVTEDIPEKVDWRDKGVVGPVLDQKLCRGCWAFGVVETMESMWAIQGNGFYSLSVQELIDCTSGNSKCVGGNIVTALNYLCSSGLPVVSAKQYPLKLVDEPCEADHETKGRRIAGFNNDCNVDENLIMELVAKGPVVAVVNARPWVFYNNGNITKECIGDERYMIHVIQIVGYDRTADIPHYIIRNSWGEDFGEEGYVRIALGQNVCGIKNNVAVLTVK